MVAHACHGHRYRPLPVPLSKTEKNKIKKGGGSKGEPPALAGTSNPTGIGSMRRGGLRCYGVWMKPKKIGPILPIWPLSATHWPRVRSAVEVLNCANAIYRLYVLYCAVFLGKRTKCLCITNCFKWQ